MDCAQNPSPNAVKTAKTKKRLTKIMFILHIRSPLKTNTFISFITFTVFGQVNGL